MANRQKVTITLDQAVVEEIDRLSKDLNESRSHMIEEAIKVWREKRLEKELIDGYLAMAEEDAKLAEANLEAGTEVLK